MREYLNDSATRPENVDDETTSMARITGPRARQELTELDKRHDASVLEGGLPFKT